MDTAELPMWRSLLFAPATAERFVAKAHRRGASASMRSTLFSGVPGRLEAVYKVTYRLRGTG